MIWATIGYLATLTDLVAGLSLMRGRLNVRQFFLITAATEAIWFAVSLIIVPVFAPFHAVVLVVQLWMWWRCGGGESVRRRGHRSKTDDTSRA